MVTAYFVCATVFADVWVDSYYRRNGTYVPGHWGLGPNENIRGHSGSGRFEFDPSNPDGPDFDGDGLPDYLDFDDDNDGYLDEQDPNQFGYDE